MKYIIITVLFLILVGAAVELSRYWNDPSQRDLPDNARQQNQGWMQR